MQYFLFFRHRSKSKKHEEKSIFYDIFIKPKENKIKELRVKKNETKIETENKIESDKGKNKIFISNKVIETDVKEFKEKNLTEKESKEKEKDEANFSTHFNHSNLKENNQILTNKSSKHHHSSIHNLSGEGNTNLNLSTSSIKLKNESKHPVKIIQGKIQETNAMKINLMSYIKHDKDDTKDYTIILTNFLNDKFVPKDDISLAKKNFFNQLIQIQPPEGVNSAVTAPLDTTKGWAPSIPSVQIDKNKTNLGDLIMRAKGGIQAGDIP
jgi:hypothetical protein